MTDFPELDAIARQAAQHVAQLAIAQRFAREWGRQGGVASNLHRSDEERRKIGKKGAAKRWKDHQKKGRRQKNP